jgi:glycosyltransferase involved in cell wall biosynthesis
MRILHVIESMGMGGAERHLANLLEPLSRLGVQNHLVTLWSGNAYSQNVLPYATVHDLALPERRALPAVPRLIRLAREVDIVHTQLPWADIVGRMAAVAARRPSVSTLQSTWYNDSNLQSFPSVVRARARAVRWLDGVTARTTRRFFAVSQSTRDTYERELGVPRDRIVVLPNTVDLRQFDRSRLGDRASVRAELGLATDEFVILMVARLKPEKGHETTFEAVASLPRELKLRLCLVGIGPERPRLEAQAQKLGVPVKFLGERDDVPRVLHASDLFVFTSRWGEGLSLALIEAMAMGLPCICSDIPENREAGVDAIEYVPLGDVAALARCIRAVVTDPRRRQSMAARSTARAQQFEAGRTAERFLREIERVL